eukprot:4167089-Amphidinium_carterae.1
MFSGNSHSSAHESSPLIESKLPHAPERNRSNSTLQENAKAVEQKLLSLSVSHSLLRHEP